jgi:hypothetical protein
METSVTRAKNLAENDIAEIVSILDGWTGALTWELLIESIRQRRGQEYTRQGLHRHVRLRDAFRLRKAILSETEAFSPNRPDSIELQVELERNARLEGEVQRLKMENNHLLEQFARWAYNAHMRGLDEAFLNRPLPKIDRERTRFGHKK